jgi:Flp pilus assembly protein TadD
MYTPPPFHAEADAYVQRGIELGNLEKHEEALKSFNKAIHLQPDNADAWNNKGHALMALGREKEAKEAFDIGYRLAMKE